MLNLQPDDVLLHIFTFVPPLSLCTICFVNSRWFKLIHSSLPLWISWDKHYHFLLPHIPTTHGNIRNFLLAEVKANEKWRKGQFRIKNNFEAHKGTMLLNMSLWEDKLATSANDQLVKLWQVPTLSRNRVSKEDFIRVEVPEQVYVGHTSSPKALQLSEEILISGGMDSVIIWSTHANIMVEKLRDAWHCADLWFSNNLLVNTSNSNLQVWDLNPVSRIFTMKTPNESEIREIRVKGQIMFGIDRHDVFMWDCRLPSSSPASIVAHGRGIIDCLEYDGANNVLFNTADEVRFFEDIRTCTQTQKIDVFNNLVVTTCLEGNKLILGEDPVQIRAFDITDISQPLFTIKTNRTPRKVKTYEQLLVCGFRSWGVSTWEC